MARYKKPAADSSAAEKREICILCKKELDILWSTPIDLRTNFIRGCGQLCADCYHRVMNTPESDNLPDMDVAIIVDDMKNKVF